MDVQKLIITGNLGQEPKIIGEGKNQFVAISIASNKSYKDAKGENVQKTTWLNFTGNGKLVEIVSSYFKKGDKVTIVAEPYNSEKEIDGKKYTFTNFNILEIQNLSPQK